MFNLIAADFLGLSTNLSEFQIIALFLIAVIAVMLIQTVIFASLFSRFLKKYSAKSHEVYIAAPSAPQVVPISSETAQAPVAEQPVAEQQPAAAAAVALEEVYEEDEEEQQDVQEEIQELEEKQEEVQQEEVVEDELEEEQEEQEEQEDFVDEEESAKEIAQEAVQEEVEEFKIIEEPIEEETFVEEDEEDGDDDEDDEDDDDEDEEEDEDEDDGEVISVGSQEVVDGEVVEVVKVYRPKYTYPVKLKMLNEVVKGFYTDLKNEFLSYGFKSRISKTKENFNFSRDNIARLVIRGKTMKLYIALDPTTIDSSYFHHKDASAKKTYAHIPSMIRIKSRKSVAKSKELIAMLAEILEVNKKRRFQPKEFSEDLSPVGLTYVEKKGYGYLMKRDGVALDYVENLPDELSARFAQKAQGRLVSRFIKTSVTVGELASRFNDGDTITIDAIKASGIGSKNANYLIIEEGQFVDKKLKVFADEFAPNAIKMIALAGGEVYKVERK